MSDPETTGPIREVGFCKPPVEHQFKPGNAGRPKGSRNKLTEDFLGDMLTAWEESGKSAIDAMIADKPGDFVKVVAGLVPKDVNLNVNSADEMSDAELAERIANLAAQLAPFLPGGTGNANQVTGDTEGAAITPRVH